MKTIADLADLATVSSATVRDLRTSRGRALALFDAATRHDRVEWQANGTTVALLSCGAGDYCVTVDGVQIDKGTIGATIATVKQRSAVFELPPTPTARDYGAWYGFWADVQGGRLVSYVKFADGGWQEDILEVEFACQHMLDRVNADFGTHFTMDEFEEGDCGCSV